MEAWRRTCSGLAGASERSCMDSQVVVTPCLPITADTSMPEGGREGVERVETGGRARVMINRETEVEGERGL